MVNLETTYMGLKLKNPIVVASSGLTNSVEKIKSLEEAGAAAVVIKSLFEEQINSEVSHLINKDPQNLYPEAEDYIWNYTRNNSITAHLELVKAAKKAVSIPIIASINCITSKEWTSFAHDFEKAGADALELNLFVVPTDRKQSGADIEQLYVDVLSKVKKEVNIPVGVKIGSYFSNLLNMVEKLMANGAASVTMFNRFYEPDINLDKLELSSSEVFSSPAEMSRTLRWVGLVNSALPKLEIAASTGIHDGAAVAKQLLAGAQVAQLCSVVYIEGAQVLNGILSDLEAFMEKWNFETIDAFRGRLSYAKLEDPMLYERAQFMKYFSSKN